jgi:hypothetical protein
MFVYLILNHTNYKYYVGKTISSDLRRYLRRKVNRALRGVGVGSVHLLDAIRHHGPEHFNIYPLVTGAKTDAELCFWERLLIERLDARNPLKGYNLCVGGLGNTSPQSSTTRAKIRATMKKRRIRPKPSVRALAIAANRSVKRTPEAKLRMSLAGRGRIWAKALVGAAPWASARAEV